MYFCPSVAWPVAWGPTKRKELALGVEGTCLFFLSFDSTSPFPAPLLPLDLLGVGPSRRERWFPSLRIHSFVGLGQKFHRGFPEDGTERTWVNFLANPIILLWQELAFCYGRCSMLAVSWGFSEDAPRCVPLVQQCRGTQNSGKHDQECLINWGDAQGKVWKGPEPRV